MDTIAIERVRDNFYDVKYWNNNCKYGEYSAKSYYMSMVEKYLDDDGTSGFKVIFDKFSAAAPVCDYQFQQRNLQAAVHRFGKVADRLF